MGMPKVHAKTILSWQLTIFVLAALILASLPRQRFDTETIVSFVHFIATVWPAANKDFMQLMHFNPEYAAKHVIISSALCMIATFNTLVFSGLALSYNRTLPKADVDDLGWRIERARGDAKAYVLAAIFLFYYFFFNIGFANYFDSSRPSKLPSSEGSIYILLPFTGFAWMSLMLFFATLVSFAVADQKADSSNFGEGKQ